MNNLTKTICYLFFVTLFFLQCATLEQLTRVQKPTVNIKNVRLTGVNFSSVNLAFDTRIQNPNPLSISLTGFGYNFLLNNSSFLTGQNTKGITIAANGESSFEIPLTLNFIDIYNAFQSLSSQDSTNYQIDCNVSFNLPILGNITIPVKKQGYVPLLKLPKISVQDFKLNKIGLSGADLELVLQTHNPNGFKLLLQNFNFDLKINQQSWAKGLLTNQVNINAKGSNTIRIPISLNFSEMGWNLYHFLLQTQELNYNLVGDINFQTTSSLLNQLNLPLNNSGKVKLSR
jgi:LEA14-like dessication related protein